MNARQAREFVEKLADATLIKDINNEAYFISENYKGWYVNEYLDYLLKLDYDKDSTLLANNFYNIEKKLIKPSRGGKYVNTPCTTN